MLSLRLTNANALMAERWNSVPSGRYQCQQKGPALEKQETEPPLVVQGQEHGLVKHYSCPPAVPLL